jgi:hypothetical protein
LSPLDHRNGSHDLPLRSDRRLPSRAAAAQHRSQE